MVNQTIADVNNKAIDLVTSKHALCLPFILPYTGILIDARGKVAVWMIWERYMNIWIQ